MSRTHRGFLFLSAAASAFLLNCVATHAASISYANIGPVPPGFSFSAISESSGTDGVPQYGSPTGTPSGLTFSTLSFSAASSNGGADLTDGQLNYTITAAPNISGIPLISFTEGGSFSLVGVGTAATQVLAGAIMRVTVLEINGAPVAPINLAPSNASVGFNLVANPGPAQPWNIGVAVNVSAQLALNGFDPTQRATKASVVIDNALIAISQPGTAASIIKGDFDVTITPEPASVALACPALFALGLVRRRGRRG